MSVKPRQLGWASASCEPELDMLMDDGRTDGRTDGWVDGGWTDRWMDACMDGRKDGWMVKTLQRENPNDQTSPCKKRLSTVRRKNFLSPLT